MGKITRRIILGAVSALGAYYAKNPKEIKKHKDIVLENIKKHIVKNKKEENNSTDLVEEKQVTAEEIAKIKLDKLMSAFTPKEETQFNENNNSVTNSEKEDVIEERVLLKDNVVEVSDELKENSVEEFSKELEINEDGGVGLSSENNFKEKLEQETSKDFSREELEGYVSADQGVEELELANSEAKETEEVINNEIEEGLNFVENAEVPLEVEKVEEKESVIDIVEELEAQEVVNNGNETKYSFNLQEETKTDAQQLSEAIKELSSSNKTEEDIVQTEKQLNLNEPKRVLPKVSAVSKEDVEERYETDEDLVKKVKELLENNGQVESDESTDSQEIDLNPSEVDSEISDVSDTDERKFNEISEVFDELSSEKNTEKTPKSALKSIIDLFSSKK